MKASARAAVDDVSRISSRLNELSDRMEEFSDAELASAALSVRFGSFGQDLGTEMARLAATLAANPAAFALLAEAFEDLN